MALEILAPAGSWDSLQAAVRCGTNAVYLGASSFNARRNADNFDALSLTDAIRYCHGRNVRVYVTLNTLIFDSEINKFISCLEDVLESGPDCLIVQDLGALQLIRNVCPEVPVCASTQMAICNAAGAHALERLGISQAVLARELSCDEIKLIHEQSDIRLEAFVHGAHCMSVSGMCYFSAALGERSGNRGLCAQPCRMNFVCKGREYALSLKDLSLVSHIKELVTAGVSSLKIEGRMKRPEYVAAAVTAVKKAINGETPDMEDLRKVFSRSGFTDGYFMAKRNAKMFGIRSQEDVAASKDILGKMSALYRRELSSIPVSMRLSVDEAKTELSVSDGRNTIINADKTIECDTGILTEEIAERSLRKTGNTPFYVDAVNVSVSSGMRVPSSSINSIKKKSLEELLEKNSIGCKYQKKEYLPEEHSFGSKQEPILRARFSKAELVTDPSQFSLVTIPLEEILRSPMLLKDIPSICAELPPLVWPGTENTIIEKLKSARALGLSHVTAGNIGLIKQLKEMGFIIHGDTTLNITNSYSLKQYQELGLSDCLLSTELTLKQVSSLYACIPTGIYAYGRLPLMYFRSCPARTKNGCENCAGYSEITDRLRNVFPVVCHQRQFSVMHNSVPLYLGDIVTHGPDFIELYFTRETSREVKNVIDSFKKKEKINISYTRGHALNGVR